MTVQALPVTLDAPTANPIVIAMLRDLLKRAREGEVQSLAVAYHGEYWSYDCQTDDPLAMASVLRELEGHVRSLAFEDD